MQRLLPSPALFSQRQTSGSLASTSQPARACWGTQQHSSRLQSVCRAAAGQPDDAAREFLDSINRKRGSYGPQGSEPAQPQPYTREMMGKEMLGEDGYKRFEEIKRGERQRVWENIRASAEVRFRLGLMPDWFNPDWLERKEAPLNELERTASNPSNEQDHEAVLGGSDGGDGMGSGSGSGPGGGDGGYWREEDPYWPLRDWGDHSMRWWTLAFGLLMAGGGLFVYASGGYVESLQVGFGAGALLLMGGMAMSDMSIDAGHLGVKIAFGTCAFLALKEAIWGWQHKRTRRLDTRAPRLELTGTLALAYCAMYALTDMSGLAEVALPTNPGGVYKSPDVAAKSKVWGDWGYGQVPMRN